jgi:acylaminoacyl-peptidase
MTRTSRTRIAAGLCATLLAATAQAMDEAAILDLVRAPNFEQVKVSPDGTRLSTLRHTDGEDSMVVLELESLEPVAVRHFAGSAGIWGYDWASDERLLVYPTRHLAEFTGNNLPTGEIIGMDPDGDDVRVLFGYRAERTAMFGEGRVIDLMPEDPDWVLVEAHEYEARGDFSTAWRMNVNDGRLQELATSPIRNGSFVPDLEHRLLVVTGSDDAARRANFHRERDRGFYERIPNSGRIVPVAPWPNEAGEDQGLFMAWDSSNGFQGISVWDPATGQADPVFHHEAVDGSDLLTDQDGRLYAVGFVDHYPNWFYPKQDHPLARLHMMLRGNFREDDVTITSLSRDGRIAVARTYSPQNPSTYYVVDTQGPRLLHRLPSRPWLEREALAPSEPVAITARDGTEIRGYLTSRAAPDAGPQPLVLLVHGGPHFVYDSWGFDSEAQVLAAAGYTVMQVNFRGSGGRGRDFLEAGFGEWGATMQDDLTDAVRWAIESGTADADRICIMGGSYGAYAALTGAFREPDLFRCAIGNAGVYDLELMFDAGDVKTRMSGMSYLKRVLGEDADLLRSRSPVHNAERIRAAVLLGHGELDDRAPIQHAHRMRRALERAGQDVGWFYRSGEGHGFFGEENQTAWLVEVLDFLETHIGPDVVAESGP